MARAFGGPSSDRDVFLDDDQSSPAVEKQLRELEADGLITRKVFAEVPPRVEYTMTDATRELEPTIKSLMAWWENHGSNTRGQV